MPGLLRGVARTAVVAGTATAVSGRVQRRQAAKYTDRDAQLAADRTTAYQQDMAAQAPPPVYAAPPPAAGPSPDVVGQLGAGQAAGRRDPHGRGVRRPEGQDPRDLIDRGSVQAGVRPHRAMLSRVGTGLQWVDDPLLRGDRQRGVAAADGVSGPHLAARLPARAGADRRQGGVRRG